MFELLRQHRIRPPFFRRAFLAPYAAPTLHTHFLCHPLTSLLPFFPVSSLSAPATPGTPGAPPLGRFTRDGSTTPKKSMFSRANNCSRAETRSTEEGSLPAVSCTMIMPPHPVPLAKKVVAEFLGTFIIIFAGTAAAIVNQKTQGSETLIGLAASGGLAVMIVILSTGHISGAHLNPSITIAFAALYCYRQLSKMLVDVLQVGELAGIAVGATVMLNILIAGYAPK